MLRWFVLRMFGGQQHARLVVVRCLAALLTMSVTALSCHRRPKEVSSLLLSETQMGTGTEAADVVVDPDGGIVVVGSRVAPGSGCADVYVFHLDAEGRESWAKSFDLGGYDEAVSVVMGQAGEFVVACNSEVRGESVSRADRVVLLGLDGDGNEMFRVRPRLSAHCPSVSGLAAVTADEWVAVGWSSQRECSCRMWAADISREGSVVWEHDFQIETCEFQEFTDIVDIGNGLYMGVGWADMPRARGGRNACVVKLEADGRVLGRCVYEKPDVQQPRSAALLRNGVLVVASWCVGRVELLGVDFSGAVVFERPLDFTPSRQKSFGADSWIARWGGKKPFLALRLNAPPVLIVSIRAVFGGPDRAVSRFFWDFC